MSAVRPSLGGVAELYGDQSEACAELCAYAHVELLERGDPAQRERSQCLTTSCDAGKDDVGAGYCFHIDNL